MLRRGLTLSLLSLLGCAHYRTVEAPAEVDLTRFAAVGVMRLSSASAVPDLPELATARLVEALHEAQPTAQLVELGPLDEALKSVGKDHLDREALKALGEKAHVQALVVGSLEVTRPQPMLSLSLKRSSGHFSADVSATLGTSLFDVASGHLLWTHGATARDSAASTSSDGKGTLGLDLGAEHEAFARMARKAALEVTASLRPHPVQTRAD